MYEVLRLRPFMVMKALAIWIYFSGSLPLNVAVLHWKVVSTSLFHQYLLLPCVMWVLLKQDH